MFLFSAEETRALLSEVPSVYHTQINDVLLTGLLQALCGWTGERSAVVDLEGHGREALFEEVDLSRTVGWFTSLYPVRLEWPLSQNVGETLQGVKETLRQVPRNGIGYGLLRYLSPEAEVKRRLMKAPQPQISFNYHGQVSASGDSTRLFRTALNPAASCTAPRDCALI